MLRNEELIGNHDVRRCVVLARLSVSNRDALLSLLLAGDLQETLQRPLRHYFSVALIVRYLPQNVEVRFG